MRADVLLALLNEFGKEIKCEARNEFNYSNYTGARMFDSIVSTCQ